MPDFDVAIIGGGPGGSTTGAMLKKYNPALKVAIFERELFPRDHIGESQLPPISSVLHELDLWDKIERAGFPVKLGGTYTWGKTTEPWIFNFVSDTEVPEHIERPGKFEGYRVACAFQVDRSIYDDILLKRAAELGCVVRQGTKVATVHKTGDVVDALELDGGERVTARYYVDASGNAAVLRKAMGVKIEVPTLLKNVAFWDYWTDPSWKTDKDEIATRINIRSLPYGWVWFIRIGNSRASVGVVCNAEWYKKSGKRPQELYDESIRSNPYVSRMVEGATPRGDLEATNDWSYVVDRTVGPNWFLVGEVAGFADPILSAGLTITQAGARELAYTILELDRGELDPKWMLHRYDDLQRRRVRQHMKFAEFWYAGNGLFEAVRENCTTIAKEAGLRMKADDAFRWISFGGLSDDVPGQAGIGGLDISGVKQVMARFTGTKANWLVDGKNTFKLNLAGAKETTVGYLENGRIYRIPCWERNDTKLIALGIQAHLIDVLKKGVSDIGEILHRMGMSGSPTTTVSDRGRISVIGALEAMAADYWVTCSLKRGRPVLNVNTPENGEIIYTDTTGVYE